MKSIDIRSESAVKLLAEFLDIDTGGRAMAEHFAHGEHIFSVGYSFTEAGRGVLVCEVAVQGLVRV